MKNERTRAVLGILAGEVSDLEVAARMGVDVSEVESWKQVFLDGARSATRQKPWRVPLWAAASAVLALTLLFTPQAWSAACASGLVCFESGTPAKANEINDNFSQVVTWMQQKVGTVGSANISTGGTITSGGITSGAIAATSITTTGAASFGGTATVSSGLTASNGITISAGGLNIAGNILGRGYQTACVNGLSNFTYPVCCRMDVRSGAADCRVAGNWTGSGWTTGPGNLFADTGVPGHYSLTCYDGVSGQNYPGCCRTNNNTGSVSCRVSTSWAMNDWTAGGSF